MTTKFATLVLKSKNDKIGEISATYASIDGSCPSDCAQKGAGCYAQAGNVGIHSARLNAANKVRSRQDAREVAREEARQISAAIEAGKDVRPLRLHVSGDCRTPSAAKALSKVAGKWRAGAYTYTHAWHKVPRAAWGNVSVLASVDRREDIKVAQARGYAVAIIVKEHSADGKAWDMDGTKVIPCPNQTRGVTCNACKLCMDSDKLASMGAAIAFASHGVAKKRLTVIA